MSLLPMTIADSVSSAMPLGGAAASGMTETVRMVWPEIVLFIATCVVMVLGLSRTLGNRQMTAWVAGLGLVISGVLALTVQPTGSGVLPNLMPFAKAVVAGVGLVLLLLAAGTVDRGEEERIALGRLRFDPLRTNRAEFYAFFLFSLTGLMLCASSPDLIWLFLALELTSLPTYIMVILSRTGRAGARSQEAGVKYFFLGALGAATFLYGFALIYGGTGATRLVDIAQVIQTSGLNSITLAGLLLALVGVGFKIAAVPMHFYTADVYEGAASPVSAMLAFVPKMAGFVAILLLCATVGWRWGERGSDLPDAVRLTLWVIAALTMTVGNVLALLQSSVKRMLAYSSIAHSGYMLVGVIAGPVAGSGVSGVSAVLFYLLVYGLSNAGCFAVLACMERRGSRRPGDEDEPDEVERLNDLRGLWRTHPVLAGVMVVCALGLMGFPPLLGFFAKLPLFQAGISAGELPLVIILGVNSAIGAYYYLRLAALPLLEDPDAGTPAPSAAPFPTRTLAAVVCGGSVLALVVVAGHLLDASQRAAAVVEPSPGPHNALKRDPSKPSDQ